MGHRRLAREAALQILYQIELGQFPPAEAQRNFWVVHTTPPEVRTFAAQLIDGVIAERTRIDELLASHSAHWRVSRMAAVDRNILRIAVFELLCCDDVPMRVTINEAIEIGKKYGTIESGAFINGILDQVAKQVEKHA